MSEPLWQPRTDRAARLLGAGFLVFGTALLGFQLKVIHDAVITHAERVSYWLVGFGMGEFAAILGGYWLVRGLAGYTAVRQLRQHRGRLRWIGIAAFATALATLLALRLWLETEGYSS